MARNEKPSESNRYSDPVSIYGGAPPGWNIQRTEQDDEAKAEAIRQILSKLKAKKENLSDRQS